MLKSNYIDPSFQSTSRLEFKLQSAGECVYNTVEMTNFGFATATGATPPAVPKLKFGGLANLIRNAYLYSGSMELESIKDVCVMSGLTATLGDGDGLRSLEAPQAQTSLTAKTDTAGNVSLDTQALPQLLGNVMLSDIFPCMRAIKKWTNYPELRVVFELNTTIADMFQNQGAGSLPTAYTLSSPVLKYDKLNDPEMKMEELADPDNYKSMAWMTLYNEVQSVAAGSTSASLKLRGFQGKNCMYMLVQGVPTAAQSDAFLGFGYSQLFPGETQQITVNNRKLLPLNGLDTPAKKQMSMEAFKPCGLYGAANIIGTGYNAYSNNVAQLLGKLSFARFSIGQRITDLQFDYGTQAVAAGGRTLRFIGAVSKQMVRDKSGVVLEVVY